MRFALILSCVCFAIAVFVNAASFFGVGLMDHFVLLHFLIFVLMIPAVRLEKQRKAAADLGAAPERWPSWVGYLALFSFPYFMINFFLLFYLSDGGTPAVEGGQYILHSHGHVIRTLTESEYRWQVAHATRMFSSGWMMFYSALIGIFSGGPVKGGASVDRGPDR